MRDLVCLIVVERKEHQRPNREEYHHEQDHEKDVAISGGVEDVLFSNKSHSNLFAFHALDLHWVQRDVHDYSLYFQLVLIHIHDIGLSVRVLERLGMVLHQ